LPWFNDTPTFEFVNLVKTHEDENDGARVIDDTDDPFDSSVDLPELTRLFKLGIWFVVVMRFTSVWHGSNQMRLEGGVISSLIA
jgi:hypothetical protein